MGEARAGRLPLRGFAVINHQDAVACSIPSTPGWVALISVPRPHDPTATPIVAWGLIPHDRPATVVSHEPYPLPVTNAWNARMVPLDADGNRIDTRAGYLGFHGPNETDHQAHDRIKRNRR